MWLHEQNLSAARSAEERRGQKSAAIRFWYDTDYIVQSVRQNFLSMSVINRWPCLKYCIQKLSGDSRCWLSPLNIHIVYSSEKYDGMQPSEFVTFFAVNRKRMRGCSSLVTAVRFWNEKCDHDGFKFATSFFVEAVVYCVWGESCAVSTVRLWCYQSAGACSD